MDSGQLVPDDIIIDMIAARIGEPDWRRASFSTAFRGRCRRREALDEMLAQPRPRLDHVILIEVDEAAMIDRLAGRFTCARCGASYHERYHRPRVGGCVRRLRQPRIRPPAPTTGRKRSRPGSRSTTARPRRSCRIIATAASCAAIDGMTDIETVTSEIDEILG